MQHSGSRPIEDLLLVKETLGHRSISSTMKYAHILPFKEDEFISKAARSVKQAQELVEMGYDYVCDVESYKLFRKRK